MGRKHILIISGPKNWGIPLIISLAILALVFWRIGFFGSWATEDAISWALAGKTIVVDSGHGGNDPGVVAKSGIKEKELNLAITKNLAELLRQSGANVIMTRENDTPLSANKQDDLAARVRLVAENEADLFISIHSNSFPQQPSQHGAQVFFNNSSEESRILAETIQAQLAQEPVATKRVALKHQTAYLLKNIQVPAVIVEVGFLSNPEESQKLENSEYQWQLAYKVFAGIVDYYTRNIIPDEGNKVENSLLSQ